jgi:tetratricopeptide (TPR) repeat protein
MAQAPSPATKSADLPTIIIDPSAYEPEHPVRSHTVYDSVLRLTRVTLAVAAVGGATFAFAQMLDVDSLLSSPQVSALTSVFAKPANKNSESRSAPASEQGPVSAPALQELPARETALLGDTLAPETALADDRLALEEPTAVDDGLAHAVAPADEGPEASPPPVQKPVAIKVRAAEGIAATATPAARLPASQAPSTAGATLTKPVQKTTDIQEEIRNARRLLATNRLEQAEAAYRNVLALNDSEPTALLGLARVQLARGQTDEALLSATRAIDKAPAGASAYLTLGDILRARGDKQAAQLQYDRAAELKRE